MQGGEEVPHPNSPLPARSLKDKSRVLHEYVIDKDLQKIYEQPQFTLRDFIVEFAASEDVPVGFVEKSLYSTFADCELREIFKGRYEPRNTRLSTQQLQLPDDLPEVCKRVPPKQLLIEMAAVIREQLNKVVSFH